MKNKIITLLIVFNLMLCTKPPKTEQTLAYKSSLPSSNEFTYQHKTSFELEVDSTAEMKYKVLDSAVFFKLFQNTTLERYYSSYTKNFLYSYQDSTNSVRAVAIVFVEDFYNYYLKYLTFNERDGLIDSLDVAGFGGDGGSGFKISGHFKNDSVYYRTMIHINNTEDPVSGEWMEENDTLETRFLFRENGQIIELVD